MRYKATCNTVKSPECVVLVMYNIGKSLGCMGRESSHGNK